MRRLSFALATAAPLLFAGCTLLKQMAASSFQKPTLALKDARVSEISLAGATVDLVFDVDNPNDQGISLAQTDYLLKIEGKQLVGGKPPAGLKVPARGKAEVVLPASIKFAELGQSIATLFDKERVGYEASGHIGVDTAIGLVALPFSKSGEIPMPKMPQVSVGTPSIRDLSFSGATLNVPLNVSNANPFAIPLGALIGTLKVDGASLGSVETRDMGRVPAGGKQVVEIPLKLKYSDAMVAMRALKAGKAKIDFKGELRSGGATLPVEVHQDVNLRGEQQAKPDTQKRPLEDDQSGSAGD